MMLEIGDIFRYYHSDGVLWLGVVQQDGKKPDTQVVEWLAPLQTHENMMPNLHFYQVTLFDKALK